MLTCGHSVMWSSHIFDQSDASIHPTLVQGDSQEGGGKEHVSIQFMLTCGHSWSSHIVDQSDALIHPAVPLGDSKEG